MRSVVRFLGVEDTWAWDLEHKARAGASWSMPEPSPTLIGAFRPVYAGVRERFGDAVPETWRR